MRILAEKLSGGLYTSSSPVGRGEEDDIILGVPDSLEDQIEELLEARCRLNKVHSDGYFENFYPQADKSLKEVLHNKTIHAKDSLRAPVGRLSTGLSDRAMKSDGVGSITITITLPK